MFDDRIVSLGWRNGSSSESGFENGSPTPFSSNEWPTGSYSWYSDRAILLCFARENLRRNEGQV